MNETLAMLTALEAFGRGVAALGQSLADLQAMQSAPRRVVWKGGKPIAVETPFGVQTIVRDPATGKVIGLEGTN